MSHAGRICFFQRGARLRGGEVAEALAAATSSVFSLLRRTRDAGAAEMALIEAQEELVAPSERFVPVRI